MLSGAFEHSDGFRTAIGSILRGDGKQFPLTIEDFSDLLKVTSTGSNALRFKKAIELGRIYSKNDTLLASDVSKGVAATMFLTGLTPQGVTDIHTYSWAAKDEKREHTEAERAFSKEFGRWARALDNNDPEAAKAHMKRGLAQLEWAGYPREDFHKAISMASKAVNQDLLDRIVTGYLNKSVSEARKELAREQYRTIIKQKESKK
jgi:hypothetical protein